MKDISRKELNAQFDELNKKYVTLYNQYSKVVEQNRDLQQELNYYKEELKKCHS